MFLILVVLDGSFIVVRLNSVIFYYVIFEVYELINSGLILEDVVIYICGRFVLVGKFNLFILLVFK